ncbi:MAG: hypothetical protein ABEJ04_04785 [Halobacteriaceae archaeon]
MSVSEATGSIAEWIAKLAGFVFAAAVWIVLWFTPTYNHLQQGNTVMAALGGFVLVLPVLVYVVVKAWQYSR